QGPVQLEQGLAAGADHKRPRSPAASGEKRCHLLRQGHRRIATAAIAVHAHEVGVAKLTHRLAAVFLAARPQVASGKATKHRRPAGPVTLTLQSVKYLLDLVTHMAIPRAFIFHENAPQNYDKQLQLWTKSMYSS